MLKFLLVVAMIAGIVYALMWTIERRRALGADGSAPRPRREAKPPTRQVAPDDDEEFLRELERKRRKDSTDP